MTFNLQIIDSNAAKKVWAFFEDEFDFVHRRIAPRQFEWLFSVHIFGINCCEVHEWRIWSSSFIILVKTLIGNGVNLN